jgi:hypothetical protein
LVATVIDDVPVPVLAIDGVVNVMLVFAKVKANISSMPTVTVTCPAVEVATVPVSIGVVQVESE